MEMKELIDVNRATIKESWIEKYGKRIDKNQFDVYLDLKKQINDYYIWILSLFEKEKPALIEEIRRIIQDIEKKNEGMWYASPWLELTENLILEVEITSYNMGVVKYLEEIEKVIEKGIEKGNINYIKGVDVYWKDTLPGKGNLGIRME